MKDVSVLTMVEVLPDARIESVVQAKVDATVGNGDSEDPFLVCDVGDLAAKHARWQLEFPLVQPHYAVKCNPDPVLLQTLVAMGTGFDCASKAEINRVLDLGVAPERIIFANPCKQKSHILYAKQTGVKWVVFDNENELYKMKKLYPEASLVLRIQTDDSASICRFSMKYGADPNDCPQLIDVARRLELNVVGISFHVGSGCQDANAYVEALRNARKLFDYAKSAGYDFDLLDIGGGFPGTDDVDLSFEEITAVVNHQLEELFPRKQYGHVSIIAEPGRFYAASAFTLVTNVIASREVPGAGAGAEATKGEILGTTAVSGDGERPAYMYYINDGLYGSFNCLFYDHARVSPTLLKAVPRGSEQFATSIWGPTCDGLDRIVERMLLPRLDTGDWIVWKDMGAYTIAAGSAFNGFKTQKIFYFATERGRDLLSKLTATKIKGVEFGYFPQRIKVKPAEGLKTVDDRMNQVAKEAISASM